MKILNSAYLPTCLLSLLAACGGLGNGTTMVAGTVNGLFADNSLVLENNNANPITINANGSFHFSGQLSGGQSYSVTVSKQPVDQSCVVTNGSGVVGAYASDVSNILVSCSGSNGAIYGTVSGLAQGLTMELQNFSSYYYTTNTETITIKSDGSFVFGTLLKPGYFYDVTVLKQPSGQTCTVADGSGTIPSLGVINGVAITCS